MTTINQRLGEMMIPTKKDFMKKLEELKADAKENGLLHLIVTSKDLHNMVGGNDPGNHRMPSCCAAMYDSMNTGDDVLQAPPKGKGSTLKIKYSTQ